MATALNFCLGVLVPPFQGAWHGMGVRKLKGSDAHNPPAACPAPHRRFLGPMLLPAVAGGAARLLKVFTQQRYRLGETGASAKATAELMGRRCRQGVPLP